MGAVKRSAVVAIVAFGLTIACRQEDTKPPNVWLGTSVEDERVCQRIDRLRECRADVRFLSCEPLIGPLPQLDLTGIHWVIVGGESGIGHRWMNPDWVRDIRDQCIRQCVPFFFYSGRRRIVWAAGKLCRPA